MFDFNSREYSIRELYDSYKRGETILSPKFQRRTVWDYKAKSFLIDSIITGFPIPRIFIRESTSLDMTARREIVDGQQRLKTIFDFLCDGFRISRVHNKEYGGMFYSDLPVDVKKKFLSYPISAILLIDLDDDTIISIFARLNTYSVKLNNQELLNSQFFGLYKQLVYRLAQEYRTFWINSGILSEKEISRMGDAKLVSDLLATIVNEEVVNLNYEQYKKLYSKYDDEFEGADELEKNFKIAMDAFAKMYPDNFKDTAFSRGPLFYSTFLSLYHIVSPLACFESIHQIDIERDMVKIRTVLDEINWIATCEAELPPAEEAFVFTLKKTTTAQNVRKKRCSYIISKLTAAVE